MRGRKSSKYRKNEKKGKLSYLYKSVLSNSFWILLKYLKLKMIITIKTKYLNFVWKNSLFLILHNKSEIGID